MSIPIRIVQRDEYMTFPKAESPSQDFATVKCFYVRVDFRQGAIRVDIDRRDRTEEKKRRKRVRCRLKTKIKTEDEKKLHGCRLCLLGKRLGIF